MKRMNFAATATGFTTVVALAAVLATARADSAPTRSATTLAASPSTDAVAPTSVPIRAFSRSAAAGDALPDSTVAAIGRLGIEVDDTRQLTELADKVVLASRVHNNGFDVCFEFIEVDGVSTATCNTVDGVSRGTLGFRDDRGYLGLVDDTVARVEIRNGDGKVIANAVPVNNVYYAVIPSSEVANATLIGAAGDVRARSSLPSLRKQGS